MPNINAVLNEQIRRLSRREINTGTRVVKKATAQFRHAIAALKKQVADLTKRFAVLERQKPSEPAVPPEVLEKGRFRAMGVRAHRAKLDLSADAYGKLVGVSDLTIYHWESGKAKPRNKQTVARWLAIRGLGKREAMERLGMSEPKAAVAKATATKPRPRGKFKQTGEQSILSLLKGRKALVTSQINQAWKKEGRRGTADVTLGLMVKARKLKRTKVKGERGSRYSAR